MKAWLWQFLSGYVKIKIEGLKLLQFLNDAAASGIRLEATSRDSYSRVIARVSWRDYRRLLALSRNRPLRISAVWQGGLPYISSLAFKRMAFTAGLLLCIAALAAVNRFVLDVRVTGCTTPGLEARVTAVLQQEGLKPGAAKWTLDLHRCEKELMLELQEVSFAAIRVNGVVANVTVVEGVQAPELIDKDTPCDVVAGRDAVIRKMTVYAGQPMAASGDTVRRGQVLVSGTVTLAGGVRKVHAQAEVLASIWYEGRGAATLFAQSSVRTGPFVERKQLVFAGFEIPVGEQGPPAFEQYDTQQHVYYLLGSGLKGPKLVVTDYYEVRRAIREESFEQAQQAAQLQALGCAQALVPPAAQIIDSRTVYEYTAGSIIAKVYIETLENIALEERDG